MIRQDFQKMPPPFPVTPPAQLSHRISGQVLRSMACASLMRVCRCQKPLMPAACPSGPSRRWEADNRAPLAVLKLLRLLAGRLDALDSAFAGFWIHQGRIFNDQFPQGIFAGDLRATNYVQEERNILRHEIDRGFKFEVQRLI
jgi:hypothetical protein